MGSKRLNRNDTAIAYSMCCVPFFKDKTLENLDNEEWVDVFGYDGLYSVSNLGRVKSERRYSQRGRLINEKILSQCFMRSKKCKSPVLYVTLYSYIGEKKSFPVHYLVGISFLREPDKSECFCHNDKIMTNNTLNNISVVKKSVSSKMNYEKGNQKPKTPVFTPKPVKKYKRLSDGKIFVGGLELKNEYDKDVRSNIDGGIKKNKKRYGSFWESFSI
jgi:hypothetical protein